MKPSMKRLVVLLALALLSSAGCAGVSSPASSPSSTANSAPGAAPAVQWQALANQATKAMGVGPVYVDERPGSRAVYRCWEMRIELGTQRQVASARATLAHELGHHVLRHCGESPAQEMEANALAVKILEIWGDSPAQARDMMARLLYANRVFTSNSVHDFCAELRDLLKRYPTATDPRQPGECGA